MWGNSGGNNFAFFVISPPQIYWSSQLLALPVSVGELFETGGRSPEKPTGGYKS